MAWPRNLSDEISKKKTDDDQKLKANGTEK